MIDKTKKSVEQISKDYANMHQDVSAELGKYLVPYSKMGLKKQRKECIVQKR